MRFIKELVMMLKEKLSMGVPLIKRAQIFNFFIVLSVLVLVSLLAFYDKLAQKQQLESLNHLLVIYLVNNLENKNDIFILYLTLKISFYINMCYEILCSLLLLLTNWKIQLAMSALSPCKKNIKNKTFLQYFVIVIILFKIYYKQNIYICKHNMIILERL